MFEFFFGKSKKSQLENSHHVEKNVVNKVQEITSAKLEIQKVTTAPADLIKTEITIKNISAENEILLNSLMATQEALEETLLSKEIQAQELYSYRDKVASLQVDQKNTIDQLHHAQKDLNQLKDEKEQLQSALESARLLEQKISTLNQDAELLTTDKLGLEEKLGKVENDLIAYNARLENYREENLALITSLNQIQEELEQLFLQKQQVQQEYSSLRSRWQRIERNHPNLLDYDDIRLITVDTVSATPYLVWEAKNFYHANIHYSKFHLVTLLNEGRGGLAVLDTDVLGDKQAAVRSLSKNVVFPHLLASPQLIAQNYKLLGNMPWKRTASGIALLEEILQKIWPKGQFPQDMDPGFWRSSLTQLLLELKQLPRTVAFEKVTLKRELRNIDYEHVWLEIENLQFGNDYFVPKFEMRIGASLIQAQGFSRYPKFEFPLIGGRVKPFESWYAESSDEYGSKFEVRFDLNKKAVDLNALSKLKRPDLILLINVILSAPQFIQYLEDERLSVARTWTPWKALAEEANVLVALILQSLIIPPVKSQENIQPPKDSIASTGNNIDNKKSTSDAISAIQKPSKLIAKTTTKVATKTTAKGVRKLAAKKVTKKSKS
jgi:hypothetical protein